jgi:hypothetical protein
VIDTLQPEADLNWMMSCGLAVIPRGEKEPSGLQVIVYLAMVLKECWSDRSLDRVKQPGCPTQLEAVPCRSRTPPIWALWIMKEWREPLPIREERQPGCTPKHQAPCQNDRFGSTLSLRIPISIPLGEKSSRHSPDKVESGTEGVRQGVSSPRGVWTDYSAPRIPW